MILKGGSQNEMKSMIEFEAHYATLPPVLRVMFKNCHS